MCLLKARKGRKGKLKHLKTMRKFKPFDEALIFLKGHFLISLRLTFLILLLSAKTQARSDSTDRRETVSMEDLWLGRVSRYFGRGIYVEKGFKNGKQFSIYAFNLDK